MTRWTIPVVCLLAGLSVGGLVMNYTQGKVENSAIAFDPVTFRGVVKKTLPAVVSIESRTTREAPTARIQPKLRDLPIPEEFRKQFENFEMPDMPDVPRSGFGSGVIVDAKGIVLTNYHVVAGADEVEVKLTDGRSFISKDIKGDRKTDLAIVRLDTKEALPFLPLGDSTNMEIGDRVLAVGAPFGLSGSVTHGIISAKGRALHMNMYEDFLQTDAAINPGNSGGPLVNMDGQVIGINTAIKSRTGGFQGVGLAISSNLARKIMDQLIERGSVQRGYLGVQIKSLDAEVARRLGVNDGVVVGQVFDGSPAAKAGLKAGDIITSFGGKTVDTGATLQRVVADQPIGKPVEMKLYRDGKSMNLDVTIEEQPEEFGSAALPALRSPKKGPETVSMDNFGIEAVDLTPEMAKNLGYPAGTSGAMIAAVKTGSVADRAGLHRGMLITRVEKQPVQNAQQLRDMMDQGDLAKGVLLQIQSPQGGIDYVVLKKS
ncbi:MAG: Do family serine endopeptidase [Gemmataceae bacterium]